MVLSRAVVLRMESCFIGIKRLNILYHSILNITVMYFFPEHGEAEGHEGTEAEENVSPSYFH